MAKLYFRYGSVGSAKTLNLLAVSHTYEQQRKKVVLMKPELDTRFGMETVKSRAGLHQEAHVTIKPDTDLKAENFLDVHCILVDECQFLSTRHIEQLRAIANFGVPVICYGLRTDFRSNLFEGSKRLMELADSIEEVKTTCWFCNRKAGQNMKQVDGKATLSGAQVQLGCEETYLPVCSLHFVEKTSPERSEDDPLNVRHIRGFALQAKQSLSMQQPIAAVNALDAGKGEELFRRKGEEPTWEGEAEEDEDLA